MISRPILESHPVSSLKKEISKTNIKGYSKMKKAAIIDLMLKPIHKDRFSHIKLHSSTKLEDIPLSQRNPREVVKKKAKKAKKEEPKPITIVVKKRKPVSIKPERATKVSAPARTPQKATVIAPKPRVASIPKVIKAKPTPKPKAEKKKKAEPKAKAEKKPKSGSFSVKPPKFAKGEDEKFVLGAAKELALKKMLIRDAKLYMPPSFYEDTYERNPETKRFERGQKFVSPPLGKSMIDLIEKQKANYVKWNTRGGEERLRQQYSKQKAKGEKVADKRFKADGFFAKWNSRKNPFGVYDRTVPGRSVEDSLISKQSISTFGTLMIAKYYPDQLPAWLKASAMEALKIVEKRTRESLGEIKAQEIKERDEYVAKSQAQFAQRQAESAKREAAFAQKKAEDKKKSEAVAAASKKFDGYVLNQSSPARKAAELEDRAKTYEIPITGGKKPKTVGITGFDLMGKKFLASLKKVNPRIVRELEQDRAEKMPVRIVRWVKELIENLNTKQLKAVMDDYKGIKKYQPRGQEGLTVEQVMANIARSTGGKAFKAADALIKSRK